MSVTDSNALCHTGEMHIFSTDQARTLLDLPEYISMGNVGTFNNLICGFLELHYLIVNYWMLEQVRHAWKKLSIF
jgi:hypothetical protein